MIHIIIKSYFTILLSIGVGALLVFLLGLFFIFKKTDRVKKKKHFIEEEILPQRELNKPNLTITSQDISAIAGEDVMATQLDLARAYVESGRAQLAKKILDHVCDKGNVAQQQEAQNLLDFLDRAPPLTSRKQSKSPIIRE